MITFISIQFFIFLGITLFLYFIFPLKNRWFVLLGASIYFYAQTGLPSIIFLLFAANIAYSTARIIEENYYNETPNKKKARLYLITGISLILILLVYTKLGKSIFDAIKNILSLKQIGFQEILPLGISYFTFSIIGYMKIGRASCRERV